MKIDFEKNIEPVALYPFTAVRSTEDIRVGILTAKERWAILLDRFGFSTVKTADNILVSANYAKAWLSEKIVLANEYHYLQNAWDIVKYNSWAIKNDFEIVTHNRSSAVISSTNKIIAPENVFVEAGVKMEYCIINASEGPVYIGKNALIMEGSMLRGPIAICDGAVVKMGAKIYGATTIGPQCVAGGEIKNSVMLANSNKAHDGYLGDSVIGEWCNLGAGTSNSNLKNNAGIVKAWSEADKEFLPVGIKCGLLMGDYSRCAINTSFNTGTTVGICSNIFGTENPPKKVNDFSWGKEIYIFDKAVEDIGNWMLLKNKTITEQEIETLRTLYNKQLIL